jgi:HAD superfamily hydrolase (TIGR01509 family)
MEYIREQYPVFAHLPHGIYSYAEGCAKPGERIFQICVERFQLRPERCLYVDDLAANVATARRAGFQVFHYDPDRHDDFLRHARSLGVLPSE